MLSSILHGVIYCAGSLSEWKGIFICHGGFLLDMMTVPKGVGTLSNHLVAAWNAISISEFNPFPKFARIIY